MASVAKHYASEAEYLARERAAPFKSEYFRGEVFATAGASLNHNQVAHNVQRLLGTALIGRPCRAYGSDLRVKTETGLYTYPDATALCGEPQVVSDGQLDILLNPQLLVEILSPSTASYDLGPKASHYLKIPSLVELLILEQDRAWARLYRREGEEWKVMEFEGLDAVIELTSVSARLPLREVFEKVALAEA